MIQTAGIVTIVVPCYNNETTIGETIESVLVQTSPRWEMICVDDGSSDDTVKVIESFCKRDERINLIIREKEPKGGSHCRNIGAFAAKGEYLIFLDGDDLLAPTCIENRLSKIEHSNYEFVVFPMGRFANNNIYNKIKAGTSLYKDRDYLYYYASGNAGWPITSPIIRKSFFVSLGGFDITFLRSQDIEYNLRAVAFSSGNYKVEYKADFDCFYRIGATTSSSLMAKLENALVSYPKLLDIVNRLDMQGLFTDRIKLSKSIVNIYCLGQIQYDILKLNKISIEYPEWFESNKMSCQLLYKDRILINILLGLLRFPRINYLMARIVSKITRKSFVQ